MMEYEVWYDPIWSKPAILEDRRPSVDADKFGNRYLLVARGEGAIVILAVPSSLNGPSSKFIEVVQRLAAWASRVEPMTERTLLGAWGLL